MKKNDVNSCKLPKCYTVSYDSHAYIKSKVTENFTESSVVPSSEKSLEETLKDLFSDKTYIILGGIIVTLIIIILFMLMGGGGGGRNRRRRRYEDDDNY